MKRLVAVLAVSLTACGTMLHNPREAVQVGSNPSGAKATVTCDGGVRDSGVTPARLVFPRRANGCRLRVEMTGFRPATVALERGYSGGYFANIAAAAVGVFGAISGGSHQFKTLSGAIGAIGLTGFFIDRWNGRAFSHDPEEVIVELEAN